MAEEGREEQGMKYSPRKTSLYLARGGAACAAPDAISPLLSALPLSHPMACRHTSETPAKAFLRGPFAGGAVFFRNCALLLDPPNVTRSVRKS